MGYTVDWMFGLLLNGQPDSHHYPCWMISGALMAVVGWVMPILLIFLLEVTARSVFLLSRLDKDNHGVVYDYTREAFRTAMLGFLSAVLFVWFLFSLFRNYAEVQGRNTWGY